MNIIVGLGNPGGEYESTRHNLGYMVVDKLAKEISQHALVWDQQDKFQSLIAKSGDIILVKPVTFMNNSGEAVKKIVDFYKVSPESIWVIHDDLDIALGKIRIRVGGSSGGHNGVDSIITHLSTDKFMRFRLGIGKNHQEAAPHVDAERRHRNVISYVLSRFSQGEAGTLRKLIDHGTDAVTMALNQGIDRAMNQYN